MTITFTVLEIKKKQNLSFSNMAAGKYYKTVFFFSVFYLVVWTKLTLFLFFWGGKNDHCTINANNQMFFVR